MSDKVIRVVFGQLILVLPFQVWMLNGYFDNIPHELDEAARIDGCGILQRLGYVNLPVAAPSIMVAAFFSFVVFCGDYLIVSIISQSQRSATIILVMQTLSASRLVSGGDVAAVTALTIVPTILLFSLVQNRLVEGLTAGAVRDV